MNEDSQRPCEEMSKSNATSREQNLGAAHVNTVIADKSRKKQKGMSALGCNCQGLALQQRVIHHS